MSLAAYATLIDRAEVSYGSGLYEDALRYADEAMVLKRTGHAAILKAQSLHALHRHGEACDFAEMACMLEPCDGPIVALAAGILDHGGHGQLARARLERMLEKPSPWAFSAMWAMGRSFMCEGKYFDGKAWLLEAKKCAPDPVTAQQIGREYYNAVALLN